MTRDEWIAANPRWKETYLESSLFRREDAASEDAVRLRNIASDLYKPALGRLFEDLRVDPWQVCEVRRRRSMPPVAEPVYFLAADDENLWPAYEKGFSLFLYSNTNEYDDITNASRMYSILESPVLPLLSTNADVELFLRLEKRIDAAVEKNGLPEDEWRAYWGGRIAEILAGLAEPPS